MYLDMQGLRRVALLRFETPMRLLPLEQMGKYGNRARASVKMTTLEQIECRGCGETFHKPTMPEFRIGAAANFDHLKTCPHCGEKNVDVVTIKGRVPRFRFRDSPRGASFEVPMGSSFLQDAMQRAAGGVRERMQESIRNAIRGHESNAPPIPPAPTSRKKLK